MKDYYKILGVQPSATDAEIKAARKNLIKKWHPDANTTNKQQAETKFKEVQEAYGVLGNPEKRKKYDITKSPQPSRANIVKDSNRPTRSEFVEQLRQVMQNVETSFERQLSSMPRGDLLRQQITESFQNNPFCNFTKK